MTGYRTKIVILSILACALSVGCTVSAQGVRASNTVWVTPDTREFAKEVISRISRTEEGGMMSIELLSEGDLLRGCEAFETANLVLVAEANWRLAEERCGFKGPADWRAVKLGFVGIAIASALDAPGVAFTVTDLYRGLAAELPNGNESKLVPNSYQFWSDVNSEMPPMDIRVHGPKRGSIAWQQVLGMVMERGCLAESMTAAQIAIGSEQYERVCRSVREDGAYIQTEGVSSSVIDKLESSSMDVALVEFDFLVDNMDRLKGLPVAGVFPNSGAIASGNYPLSWPIVLYVPTSDAVIGGAQKVFIDEILSDRASGKRGYLMERGLIPTMD